MRRKHFNRHRLQVEIDKSKIDNAKAQLDVIITQLKNTTIVSPMDGVIASVGYWKEMLFNRVNRFFNLRFEKYMGNSKSARDRYKRC